MTEAVAVHGLRELRSSLRQVSSELSRALRLALNEAAELVAEAGAAEFPALTGAAADSIVPRSTQTLARIRAGGRQAPYVPWLEFGGSVGRNRSIHREFVPGGRFLFPTFVAQREELAHRIEEALAELAESAGLETQ